MQGPGNGASGPQPVGGMPSQGSAGTQWKTWQGDADIPQRKVLIQHMYVRANVARDG